MMKTFTKITSAALIAFAVCCGSMLMAQSYNCASAVAITNATTLVIGNTVGANDNGTSGAGTCITTVGTGGQNWYVYTAALNSNVTMSTCGLSSFDTKIHVYTGTCGAFACVTGNDDACGLQTTVSFFATGGTPYYIRVGGFAAGQGGYSMSIVSVVDGGCTNPASCNYDPGAVVDDGSCITCALNCIQVSITSGTFNSEVSWSFDDSNGNIGSGGAPFNQVFCLANDCDYTFSAFDSFGDGWNGAVLTITNLNSGVVYVNEIPSGTGETYSLIIGAGLVAGCTNPIANNYNPAANCDDGTCVLCPPGEVLLIFNMFDSFGDGWDNASYTITDDLGNIAASGSLVTGTFGQAFICLPQDCYFLTVTSGIFPAEIAWEVADQNGNVIFDGGAPTTSWGFPWAGAAGCVIPGCTDSNCNNFNQFANVNDGSCQCPPANDDCADAAAIGCGVTIIGSTEFANADGTDPCGVALTSPGVWYTLVGDGSQVTLSTCASTSGIDTKLHVYTSGFVANCNALTCVAANDDACPGFLSSMTFTTTNGQIYYILVSEFGTGQGLDFQLDVTCQVCSNPLPANDGCAGAEEQISGIATVQDLCCVNPDNSVCLGFTTGYGVWFYMNTTPLVDPLGCGPAETFDFMVTNLTGTNVGMTVYEDLGNLGCANLNPIACCPIVAGACGGDISQIWTISPGTDYYFLVYTTDPVGCGEISLLTERSWIGCTDNTALNYDPCATVENFSCTYGGTPPNNLCGGAVAIACGSSTVGSTGGSTNADYPFICSGANDNGVWYSATGNGQLWTISTCGSAIDSHIEIFQGPCGGPLSCVADVASDFIGCGFFDQDDATFEFISNPGSNYLIYVYADGPDGEFTIDLDCEPVVAGCTNYAACNYNPAANVDNGTCDFFSCVCVGAGTAVQVNMFDSFGDGWDNGTYTITDGLGNVVASNTIDNADYVEDNDNFVGAEFGFDLLCLQNGCYTIDVNGSIFNSEISWNVTDENGNVLASGSSPASVGFSINGVCGCTDVAACNFNPAATVNDGSCCFGSCATLTVTAGFFPSEMTWEINGVSGGAPFTGVICLTDPCFNTFNMFDAFGDGWDNGSYTFTVGGNVVASGTLASGASGSANIAVGVEGCTDAGASNYDPAATCDDGSCCFDNAINVNLFDSFGDGWNGATYTVTDVSTGTVLATGTLATGSFGQIGLCLPTGCYEWAVTAGFIPSEVSWQIFGTDSGTISGGAPSSTLFSVGGSNCIAGCQVPSACNYNPAAGIDDCTVCDFTSCGGCTYVDADNYNPAAIIDDGSCTGFASDCPADFNEDGVVGVSDLLFFIGQYGTTCQ